MLSCEFKNGIVRCISNLAWDIAEREEAVKPMAASVVEKEALRGPSRSSGLLLKGKSKSRLGLVPHL